jgi:hypothetical protein
MRKRTEKLHNEELLNLDGKPQGKDLLGDFGVK